MRHRRLVQSKLKPPVCPVAPEVFTFSLSSCPTPGLVNHERVDPHPHNMQRTGRHWSRKELCPLFVENGQLVVRTCLPLSVQRQARIPAAPPGGNTSSSVVYIQSHTRGTRVGVTEIQSLPWSPQLTLTRRSKLDTPLCVGNSCSCATRSFGVCPHHQLVVAESTCSPAFSHVILFCCVVPH